MQGRHYDAQRDAEAVHRLWLDLGWISKDNLESMDVGLSAGTTLVSDLGTEIGCLVQTVPGTVSYQDQELSLCAVTSVTTNRAARKLGLAKRLAAQAVAQAAQDGACVAGLDMFEQGFYNQLGFGTGSYEHWVCFDPADLRVPDLKQAPKLIRAQDWAEAHELRLRRLRLHGSCSLQPPEITRSDMLRSKNGFGFAFTDEGGVELTHCFWCSNDDIASAPFRVLWMAYRSWPQFIELLSAIKTFDDEVHVMRMREPAGLQFQDLLAKPFARSRLSAGSSSEVGATAMAYWQMRICRLEECLAKTRLRTGEVRFNLTLSDPVSRYLDESVPWHSVAGDYVLTLGKSSGAEQGVDETLPTLQASVSAFTRLWLGVSPATRLAVTDELCAPQSLLRDLDEVVCPGSPHWDWDY